MAAVPESRSFRAFLPSLAIALFGAVVTWHVYYPGILSPDSLDQYRQVLAGVYSSTQPPLMTFFWAIVAHFGAGPAPMLFLQTVVWWGSLAFLMFLVFPRTYWLQAFLILIVGFWPPVFGMVGTIWRDVHMTLAMLLAWTVLAAGGKEAAPWRLVVAGLLISYASAVRLNALFAVLFPAIWIAWRLWRPGTGTGDDGPGSGRDFLSNRTKPRSGGHSQRV